ncbi:MAG TPA: hypothetical protein PKD99_01915 [Sphingopyxis sp.]|nr:hypothetical protein [Sphingopyxis sp.]HMP43833.1 hypothetical protein [Sphingopyxis sp.]HMQ18879.1 hypothetical protein [Sphingopyxis sp.]
MTGQLAATRRGLVAAILPCALMLLAHFTLHKPDPPLIHAYTFVLQWAIIGVVAHNARLGLSIGWSVIFWSMTIGLLGASWGTYFGRDVLISLEVSQLVAALFMLPVSIWLERRATAPAPL